jgi:hypothetical protein
MLVSFMLQHDPLAPQLQQNRGAQFIMGHDAMILGAEEN